MRRSVSGSYKRKRKLGCIPTWSWQWLPLSVAFMTTQQLLLPAFPLIWPESEGKATASNSWRIRLTLCSSPICFSRQQLAQETIPIVTVLTRRLPATETCDDGNEIDIPEATTLILPPLSEEQVELLACHHLSVESLPAAVTNVLHSRSLGNPLYCQHLLQFMTDDGWLRFFPDDTAREEASSPTGEFQPTLATCVVLHCGIFDVVSTARSFYYS